MTDDVWKMQYEKMLTFWADEGTRFWTRFQVFLAVNSGLLGVFPIVLNLVENISKLNSLSIVGLGAISVIGIVVSVTWFFLTISGKGIQDHWKKKIIELEAVYKNEIKINFDFDRERSWWQFKMSDLAKPIPLAFIVIWIIILSIGGYEVSV